MLRDKLREAFANFANGFIFRGEFHQTFFQHTLDVIITWRRKFYKFSNLLLGRDSCHQIETPGTFVEHTLIKHYQIVPVTLLPKSSYLHLKRGHSPQIWMADTTLVTSLLSGYVNLVYIFNTACSFATPNLEIK